MFAFTAFICPAIRPEMRQWKSLWGRKRFAVLHCETRVTKSQKRVRKRTTNLAWRQREIYFCLRLTMIVVSKNLQPSMTHENLKEIKEKEKTGISKKFLHHVHGKCEPWIAITANGGPKQFSKLNFRCLRSQNFSPRHKGILAVLAYSMHTLCSRDSFEFPFVGVSQKLARKVMQWIQFDFGFRANEASGTARF